MNSRWILFIAPVVALGVAVPSLAHAKDPVPYQSGKLLQMNSVHCGTAQKSDTSALGEIIGTDNRNTKTQDVLCQEYVLQTDSVDYHIRPRDDKHPEILPIGSLAQFRIEKDKLILRAEGMDKERQYFVVSITPRSDNASSASAMASKP
jgi:hypothetical protein